MLEAGAKMAYDEGTIRMFSYLCFMFSVDYTRGPFTDMVQL